MEAIAKTRHLKGSPRKARLVIDLIRGRNVSQALNILKFTDKRAAEPITKTLRSAIANATYLAEQQNIAIDPDDLFVKTCFVDMGAHKNRRRMRPAPQGRAFREQRHYCHITILVSSDVPLAKEEDITRKKGKKLLAKEGQSAEVKAKTSATKPKAEKKTAEPVETKEENNSAAAALTATPIAVEETKSAKAENVETEQPIETPTAEVETPETVVENTVSTFEDAPTETAEAEVAEDSVKTETTEVRESKVEEVVEAKAETIEASEATAESETLEIEEAKLEKVVEVKDNESKVKDSEASDILEVDSPNSVAKEQTEKQKAEASNAKNAQSQTPAERNETKKADEAQKNDNDILELQ